MDHSPAYIIENTHEEDLETIYWLFEQAIAYQKKNQYVGWNDYDKAFIQKDIVRGLQYKITEGSEIHGIFSICLNDELIWRTKEKGDAIYLHRIVTHPNHKGQNQFGKILHWAINYAKQHSLLHIRMDTWLNNVRIIEFYKSHGFAFVETYTTSDSPDLPIQHRKLALALLEMRCPLV
jgi:GNAT superfamily N-acetyltransferase